MNKISFPFTLEVSNIHNFICLTFITEKENEIVSPFHDIPLLADNTGKVFNMVVEIPRWTNAKMEVRFSIMFRHFFTVNIFFRLIQNLPSTLLYKIQKKGNCVLYQMYFHTKATYGIMVPCLKLGKILNC